MAQILKLNDGTRGGALGALQLAKDPFTIFESPGDSITREVSSRQRIVFLRADIDPFSNAQGDLLMKILGNGDNETNIGKWEFAENGAMLWRPMSANPIGLEPRGDFHGGDASLKVSKFITQDGYFTSANASLDLIDLPGMRLPDGFASGDEAIYIPMRNSFPVLVNKKLGNFYGTRAKEQLLTIAAAASTVDSGITFPINCLIRAIAWRIIDAPGNSATVDLGIPATPALFVSAASTVLGTSGFGLASAYTRITAATAVRVTLSVAATDQFQIGVTIMYDEYKGIPSGVWDA